MLDIAQQSNPTASRTGTPPVVEISNLTFAYGPQVIIDNLSLTVRQGEFVSIIGPSGCGKSTLLSMIDDVMTPNRGAILVGGRRPSERAVERSVVYQNFALMPWKTVRENVELGLRYRRPGLRAAERTGRVDHYLNLVGLRKSADLYPHQLSGGMQQRVGLARAFAVDPDLLLMDEPFGALDAQTAEVLREELRQLISGGEKTILFITHNLDEALQLSDRVLLMSTRPGRIKDEVSRDEVPADEKEAIIVKAQQRDRLWDHLRSEVKRLQG